MNDARVGQGRLLMSIDILRLGAPSEYEGANGLVLAITPFMGYDSVSDTTFTGVLMGIGSEWGLQGVCCGPLDALAKFKILDQADFNFADGQEFGASIGGGGGVRGSIGFVADQLMGLHGTPDLPKEDIQEVYDKIPSDRQRLALMQELADAGIADWCGPEKDMLSLTDDFREGFSA